MYWLGHNDEGLMLEAGDEVICESIYPPDVVAAF